MFNQKRRKKFTFPPHWVEVGFDVSGLLVGRRIRGSGRTDDILPELAKVKTSLEKKRGQRVT